MSDQNSLPPPVPADASDEEVEGRVIRRAARVAKLMEVGAPFFVIASAKALLDVAFDELKRRRKAAGEFCEPVFQDGIDT